MPYIKLSHELKHARYNEKSGKWHLKITRPVINPSSQNSELEEFYDTADFVLSGVGILSRWDWPDIEGLKEFKGELIHTADWKTDESGWWQSSIANWKDKVVGVIGAVSIIHVLPKNCIRQLI